MTRVVLLICCLIACGCTPSEALDKVAPKPPSVNDALGEGPCVADGAFAEPLVVDMKDHDRAKIEVALTKGPAVFRYSCDKLELLPGCSVDEGGYRYAGFSKKERVVKLHSADELHANLPSLGAVWAAKLSADLESDTSLDIALVTVGHRATSLRHVARDRLRGECDGASHFLKHAYVGAFAVSAGSKASVRTAAEVFGVGASMGASSSKFETVVDGKISACAKATSQDEAPPEGCSAILRIGLMPVVDSVTPQAGDGGEPACPKGMIHQGTICTADTAMNRCRGRDLAACQALCDRGDQAGCYWRAALDFDNPEQSLAALRPMCDEQRHMPACETVATQLRDIDVASAVPYWKKACELGYGPACDHFATDLLSTRGEGATEAERREALAAYERACSLDGRAVSCVAAGRFYIEPDPAKRVAEPDEQKALALFLDACFASAGECIAAAELVEGKPWCAITRSDPKLCDPKLTAQRPVRKDADRAQRLYRRACQAGAKHAACAGHK